MDSAQQMRSLANSRFFERFILELTLKDWKVNSSVQESHIQKQFLNQEVVQISQFHLKKNYQNYIKRFFPGIRQNL